MGAAARSCECIDKSEKAHEIEIKNESSIIFFS